jgi:hypothetical protein
VKIIIAGSRTFSDYKLLKKVMDEFREYDPEIVSGCADGTDRLGERWANERGFPIKRFPADWNEYGKSAGHIRNAQMARYADTLVLFWDRVSKGSKSMLKIAKKNGLQIQVVYLKENK